MHRLILMRHARAEPSADSGRDRDRPLSADGRAEAAGVGRILAARGLRPDRALVSSALRTGETWDLIHDALGDVEVRHETALYNAGSDVLRRFIEASEDEVGCLLVLAHNPGIHVLAVEYLIESAASPAILERLGGGFEPGSVAVFAVDPAGRCALEGLIDPPSRELAE